MVELITLEDLCLRLSLPVDAGLSSAFDSAFKGAYVALESILNQSFAYADHTDLFRIDGQIYEPTNGLYKLRLSHGFVDVTTLALSTSDKLTSGWVAAPDLELLLSSEKGFLELEESLCGKCVRVEYSAGIKDGDPIPGWLAEVALAKTISLMATTQLMDDKPQLTPIINGIKSHAASVLDRHLRTGIRLIPPAHAL